jgi:hypothetical protein
MTEHKEIVEEIVELFTTLDTSQGQREVAEADLLKLSPEELVHQLADTVHVLRGFVAAAERINEATVIVLSDCLVRTRETHKLATSRV